MDEVTVAVGDLKREWGEAVSQLQDTVRAIESCGRSGRGSEEASALPRLNGAAQDALAALRSMQFRLDLLAQQLSTVHEVQAAQALVETWKDQLHMGLRNANFQAKANIKKAAQQERELLLGGGEESTVQRTKAGMTSAAESITESLRRTSQMMV